MTILRTLLGLTVTLLCLGCPAEEKTVLAPTQVMLRVDTDPALREPLTALRFRVALREGDTWKAGAPIDIPRAELRRWPVDIPLTPTKKADDAKWFEVVVEALVGDDVVAQTRHISGFVEDDRRLLKLSIQACPTASVGPRGVCADEDCAGDDCTTCVADGQCARVPTTKPDDLPKLSDDSLPSLDGGTSPTGTTCKAGSKICDGKNVETCNAQGMGYTTKACPASAPVCRGEGTCAQCATAADCAAPESDCQEATCDAAGKCGAKPRAARATCLGGVCDGSGACVGCFDDPDCPSSKPYCSQGTCVACRGDGDCGAMQKCELGQCASGNACKNQRVDPGEECDRFAVPDGVNMWNTLNCTEDCKRKVYQNCYGNSDVCDLQVLCGGHHVCFYVCSDQPHNECPVLPGYKTRCGSDRACVIDCKTDADCPSDLACTGGSSEPGSLKWCAARR